jgi:hypothetical protein
MGMGGPCLAFLLPEAVAQAHDEGLVARGRQAARQGCQVVAPARQHGHLCRSQCTIVLLLPTVRRLQQRTNP